MTSASDLGAQYREVCIAGRRTEGRRGNSEERDILSVALELTLGLVRQKHGDTKQRFVLVHILAARARRSAEGYVDDVFGNRVWVKVGKPAPSFTQLILGDVVLACSTRKRTAVDDGSR